jgi:hypothetical protein
MVVQAGEENLARFPPFFILPALDADISASQKKVVMSSTAMKRTEQLERAND